MKLLNTFKKHHIKRAVESGLLAKLQKGAMPFRKLMSYYKCAMMEIETKFRVLNEEFSLRYAQNPIESIRTRLKSPESLIMKMTNLGLPVTVESIESNLHDVAGVRVICSFIQDIYSLAECLIGQDDVELIEQKDYIKNPKPSGYRSLHLIVRVPIFLENEKRLMKVEVQLRTIAMDFWASLEHKLRYKKNISPEILRELEGELEDCSNHISAIDFRMQEIKNRISELK